MVICTSEYIDISPGYLDSRLWLIQYGISHIILKLARWQYTALTCSFPNFQPVCLSMSAFNCCFVICVQVSQETVKVVWYSHLFMNFPQLVVTQTVNEYILLKFIKHQFYTLQFFKFIHVKTFNVYIYNAWILLTFFPYQLFKWVWGKHNIFQLTFVFIHLTEFVSISIGSLLLNSYNCVK